MKIKVVFSVITLFVILNGCQPVSQTSKEATLTDPLPDTYLVVGAAMVENTVYMAEMQNDGFGGMGATEFRRTEEVVYEGIEVAIIARVMEEGKAKLRGFYAQTDKDGYFFLDNVPEGEYALKGIRFYLEDGRYEVITADLMTPDDPYMRRPMQQEVVFKGNYFPVKGRHRIINLEHNVFMMSQVLTVGYKRVPRMSNHRFLLQSQTYNRPYVEDYYMTKYPMSGWSQFLGASMQSAKKLLGDI